MDGLQSALEMWQRLLCAYKQAKQEPEPAQGQALMSLVIAGAGPIGVALVGAIAEMARPRLTDDLRIATPR